MLGFEPILLRFGPHCLDFGFLAERLDGQTDGRTDGQMDGRTDGQMYEQNLPIL